MVQLLLWEAAWDEPTDGGEVSFFLSGLLTATFRLVTVSIAHGVSANGSSFLSLLDLLSLLDSPYFLSILFNVICSKIQLFYIALHIFFSFSP